MKDELKRVMDERGLNYTDMADCINVNPSTLWRWLNQPERSSPSVKQAQSVAGWALDNNEAALVRVAALYLMGARAGEIAACITGWG